MTINDLKMDIISSISMLSDVSLLKEIKKTISANDVSSIGQETSIWKGAELELREEVSFDQLMQEQEYKSITFSEFTEDTLNETWEVSLDFLLGNSN